MENLQQCVIFCHLRPKRAFLVYWKHTHDFTCSEFSISSGWKCLDGILLALLVSVLNKFNRRTEPKPHKASSFICILSIVYSFLQLMNTKQLFHWVPNFFNGPISHSFFAEASTSLTVFWAPLLPRQLQQSNSFTTFIWASFSGKDPKQPGGRQLGHFHIQEKE